MKVVPLHFFRIRRTTRLAIRLKGGRYYFFRRRSEATRAEQGGTRGPRRAPGAAFQQLDRFAYAFAPITLMPLFNSLMSPEISLLVKNNSLLRILGNSPKKHRRLLRFLRLRHRKSGPKSMNFPVFSLVIREFRDRDWFAADCTIRHGVCDRRDSLSQLRFWKLRLIAPLRLIGRCGTMSPRR